MTKQIKFQPLHKILASWNRIRNNMQIYKSGSKEPTINKKMQTKNCLLITLKSEAEFKEFKPRFKFSRGLCIKFFKI